MVSRVKAGLRGVSAGVRASSRQGFFPILRHILGWALKKAPFQSGPRDKIKSLLQQDEQQR